MERLIWVMIMAPVSALFTGIGIYGWKKKTPMWFWSGSTVKESEIRDIPAYNRANGILWIGFSCIFWISLVLGIFQLKAGGICLIVGSIAGCIALPVLYTRIYDSYKTDSAIKRREKP